MENRTARLTILIDPRKKQIFEEICAAHDLTPSQVVRKLIRQYIIDNAGDRELPDWLRDRRPSGRAADRDGCPAPSARARWRSGFALGQRAACRRH
jgi:hypothetical protein